MFFFSPFSTFPYGIFRKFEKKKFLLLVVHIIMQNMQNNRDEGNNFIASEIKN